MCQDAISVIQSNGGDAIVFKFSRCNSENPAIDPDAMVQIFEMVLKFARFSFIQRASYEQLLQINNFNQRSGRFFSDLNLIVVDEGFIP